MKRELKKRKKETYVRGRGVRHEEVGRMEDGRGRGVRHEAEHTIPMKRELKER
jgi:hypothetical protein